jgi:hypothetical protein
MNHERHECHESRSSGPLFPVSPGIILLQQLYVEKPGFSVKSRVSSHKMPHHQVTAEFDGFSPTRYHRPFALWPAFRGEGPKLSTF